MKKFFGWVALGLFVGQWALATPLRRHALLAGASGETEVPNFFLADLHGLRAQLESRGWKTWVVAGSRDGLLPGSKRASNANLSQGIQRILSDAKSGEEVLLLFHSHGREQETYWGQRSHSIVSEDKDVSGSDPGFDLDSIEPEMLKARARGVRIALVDLSCYSGATQALQGAVCTVTLASSRYVSLCSGRPEERHFNSRFFQLPPAKGPADLETQFLEARRSDRDSINLPRISSRPTPALKGWDEFLVGVDPLDTFEDLKNLRTGAPAFDAKKLLAELDRWIQEQSQRIRDSFLAVRKELGEKLRSTLVLRDRLERTMPKLAKDYDEASIEVEVPGRKPVALSPGNLVDLLRALQEGKVPDGYTDVQRNLLKAMAPVTPALASRYSKPLTEFQKRRDAFDQSTEGLAQAAGALFDSERKLYDLAPVPAGKDPCSEFSL